MSCGNSMHLIDQQNSARHSVSSLRNKKRATLFRIGFYGFLLGTIMSLGIAWTMQVRAVAPGTVKTPNFSTDLGKVQLKRNHQRLALWIRLLWTMRCECLRA